MLHIFTGILDINICVMCPNSNTSTKASWKQLEASLISNGLQYPTISTTISTCVWSQNFD